MLTGFDVNNIFSLKDQPGEFDSLCRRIYAFQLQHNPVYREWCRLNDQAFNGQTLAQIPALPISLFKTHRVRCGKDQADVIFESSGTTGMTPSRHYVHSLAIYRQSFLQAFHQFYGDPASWCVLGLLPSYLERANSSLVVMVDELIRLSGHPQSGFYLHEWEQLTTVLKELEKAGQKTWLIGVTFGLLDFAEKYPMPLRHTVVMETGGMKGRRRELTRTEVHAELKQAFDLPVVHAEYGMTELLSQAYAKKDGRFYCPPWMKVLVREEDDPLQVRESGEGVLQIIDLANVYSCSFIATEDMGKVWEDGSFEVWGRLDNSDIRGCSLLTA
ncbi:MAG TPA: hypothetical protein VG842_04125 [Sediminibacterium sp.]|nr:hypothetical protein [Sediminibacterium sp.]